jgi:hypothetical protein
MVVVLKLKGSSETLKRGFDALNPAFGAILPTPQQVRRAPVHAKELSAASTPNEDAEDFGSFDTEAETEQEESVTTQPSPPRKPSPLKFLPDFKLNVSEVPWKACAAQKNPKTEPQNVEAHRPRH